MKKKSGMREGGGVESLHRETESMHTCIFFLTPQFLVEYRKHRGVKTHVVRRWPSLLLPTCQLPRLQMASGVGCEDALPPIDFLPIHRGPRATGCGYRLHGHQGEAGKKLVAMKRDRVGEGSFL